MTTQSLFLSTPFSNLKKSLSPQRNYFSPRRAFFTVFCSKPISKNRPSPLRTNGYYGTSHVSVPRPAHLENPDENRLGLQFSMLQKKLEAVGIETGLCVPGQHNNLLCPACQGGETGEKSFSLYIAPDGGSASWLCFRGKCGYKGSQQAFAGSSSYSATLSQETHVKIRRQISEEELQLEPLCNELLAYFAERLISKETLQRNAVKQRKYDDQIVIAFPYNRDGTPVGCKYRDVHKNFWQEANTEKIFYGLDDIKGQSDIIIVEGEMDKLAMEEAGFRNCVSVPDGAPPSVSSKELPAKEKDTKYQYLWNCKDQLHQASRIILATDGDAPGQALAEELARRLGKEKPILLLTLIYLRKPLA
ncbi:twinkle homolog protein, chloroplastic/mitochondrial-like, partial [Gastrolobium bilobum]|uniref:twinkle homolog protein, chloroplastic/mitochondrial-like n=1 Tax=Gastrolobium bilobum TaxID=150636 RepID=UPI002AB1C644